MKTRGLVMGLVAVVLVAACKPSSIGEAEAKGDVAWLDADGSPAAIDALGRLADSDPKAADALKGRKSGVETPIAAWAAVKRGAAWGSDVLHAGLQDPARANDVASAMDGRDPLVAPFLPDVEAALGRLSAGGATGSLAVVLAAAGPTSHDAVVRRLADKTTRGPMCGGIASPTSNADARVALRNVPPGSRDDAACVATVLTLTATDDATLRWLAQVAEPGLLGAASKSSVIDCVRLHRIWADALAARDASQSAAMTVPLSNAVERCPAQIDGVLADALKTRPDSQGAVVGAIDPFSPDAAQLKATCGALGLVAKGKASAVAKERARDALAHGCLGQR